MIRYDTIRYDFIWYDMIWNDIEWYLIFSLTSGMFDCSSQQRLRHDRIDRYHPLCIITQNRYIELSFFDICDEILFIFIITSLFIKASLFAPLQYSSLILSFFSSSLLLFFFYCVRDYPSPASVIFIFLCIFSSHCLTDVIFCCVAIYSILCYSFNLLYHII